MATNSTIPLPLRWLCEQLHDGVIITDLDGLLLFANEALAARHGYTPAELQGQFLNATISPESVVDGVKIVTLILSHQQWKGNLVSRHRDGHWLPTDGSFFHWQDNTGETFVLYHFRSHAHLSRYGDLVAVLTPTLDALDINSASPLQDLLHQAAKSLAPWGVSSVVLQTLPREDHFTVVMSMPSSEMIAKGDKKVDISMPGRKVAANLFANSEGSVLLLPDLAAEVAASPVLRRFVKEIAACCGPQQGLLIPFHREDAQTTLLLLLADAFTAEAAEALQWYARQVHRSLEQLAAQREKDEQTRLFNLLQEIVTFLSSEPPLEKMLSRVLECLLLAGENIIAGWMFLREENTLTVSLFLSPDGQLKPLNNWQPEQQQQLLDCIGTAPEQPYGEIALANCPPGLHNIFPHQKPSRLLFFHLQDTDDVLALALSGDKVVRPLSLQFIHSTVTLLRQALSHRSERHLLVDKLQSANIVTTSITELERELQQLGQVTSPAQIAEELLHNEFMPFATDGALALITAEGETHLSSRGLADNFLASLPQENLLATLQSCPSEPVLLSSQATSSPWQPCLAFIQEHHYADAIVLPLSSDGSYFGGLLLLSKKPLFINPWDLATVSYFARGVAYHLQHLTDTYQQQMLRQQYAYLWQQIPQGLLLLDAKLRVVDINEVWSAFSGLSRQEIVGRSWTEIAARHHCTCINSEAMLPWEEAYQKQQPVSCSCQTKRDGTIYTFRIEATPILNERGSVSLIGVSARFSSRWEQFRKRLTDLLSWQEVFLAPKEAGTLFDMAIVKAQQLFPNEYVSIGYVDWDQKRISFRQPGPWQTQKDIPLDQENSVMASVARTGEMINVPDMANSDLYAPSPFPAQSELCAPIQFQGKVAYIINVGSTQKNAFSIVDIHLLQIFTAQIAAAMIHMQTLEDKEKQWQQFQAIQELAAVWLKPRPHSDQMQTFLSQLKELVPHNAAMIAVAKKGYFEVIAERGHVLPTAILGRRFTLSDSSLFTRLATAKKPFPIGANTRRHLLNWSLLAGDYPLWCMPLYGQHNVIGCLLLEPAGKQGFPEEEVTLIALTSILLSVAVANLLAEEHWQSASQQLIDLQHLSTTLISTDKPEEILKQLLKYSGKLLHWTTASILFLSPKEGPAAIVGSGYQDEQIIQQTAPTLLKNSPLVQAVLHNREPVIIPDVRQDDRWITVPTVGYVRGWLGVPIVARDHVWGILMMDSEYVGFFTQHDLEIAQTLAAYAALAIETGELLRSVQQHNVSLKAAVAQQVAELKEEKEMLEVILQQMDNPLVVTDTQARIIYWNTAFSRLTGFSAEDMKGLLYYQLYTGDDSTNYQLQQDMLRHLRQGESWQGEVTQRRKNGKTYLAQVAITPVLDKEQQVHRVVIVQRDVTEERQAVRLKDAFVSRVAHELRTPLTTVKLHLDLLQRGKPEKRAHYMTVLKREVNYLAQLIDDVLSISRLDTGKISLHRQRQDWREVVRDAVDNYLAPAKILQIKLTYSVPPEPCWIEGDKMRLTTILSNLLDNSLKFTPASGKVRVWLEPCRRRRLEGFCLHVHNSGVAIPPEEVPHLFDRFFQGSIQPRDGEKGNGLGLFIAQSLARLHGGEITVRSNPEKGTRFTVWLPAYNQPQLPQN